VLPRQLSTDAVWSEVFQESASVPTPVKTAVVPLTRTIAPLTHPISSAAQRPPAEKVAIANGPTSVQGLHPVSPRLFRTSRRMSYSNLNTNLQQTYAQARPVSSAAKAHLQSANPVWLKAQRRSRLSSRAIFKRLGAKLNPMTPTALDSAILSLLNSGP